MSVCSKCGKSFSESSAREQFDNYFTLQGEAGVTYDQMGEGMCAECAIEETNDGLSGWNAMPDEYKNTYDN